MGSDRCQCSLGDSCSVPDPESEISKRSIGMGTGLWAGRPSQPGQLARAGHRPSGGLPRSIGFPPSAGRSNTLGVVGVARVVLVAARSSDLRVVHSPGQRLCMANIRERLSEWICSVWERVVSHLVEAGSADASWHCSAIDSRNVQWQAIVRSFICVGKRWYVVALNSELC